MVAPGFAFVGPVLTMERSGLPAFAAGAWILSDPSEGVPPIMSELPPKRCAPGANSPLNWTKPGVLSVRLTTNVYDQVFCPDGVFAVGPDVITTFGDDVKLERFSMPRCVLPPLDLV